MAKGRGKGSKSKGAGSRSRSATPKTASRRTNTPAPASTVLDPESRHEVAGIIICALAVMLAIAVQSRSQATLPVLAADRLRLVFGVGAYAVPVALLLWGVSFFIRAVRIDETRVGIGLSLVLLSGISMIAVPLYGDTQWDNAVLMQHGGYIGGSVAWLTRTSLGSAISYVLLVAVMLVGLVFAGMSISGLLGHAAGALRHPQEDADKPEEASSQRRKRAAKTLPLSDFQEPLPDSEPEPARVRREVHDPESARPTVPTTTSVAPHAMEGFELPSLSMLTRSPQTTAANKASDKEHKHTAGMIEQTFATFDIGSRVVSWVCGPTVTMFEVEIAKGVKVNRITALSDDLALSLAAPTIRILAPIPGKSYVGIEVPNTGRTTVTLGDVLGGETVATPGPLVLGIGKDVAGDAITADLAAMPHLLIAGSTGTGKSVCINSLIMSILMRTTPAEVRLILIDPKRIELNLYNGVPHLYVPVVTESKEAASALRWAVNEMEARLKRLQVAGARNIAQYNAAVHAHTAPEGAVEMPYLVIFIDELADLMMVAAKDVEDSICRIAQLARAAGIHLIVATQRPSTDIITGLIKTNITNRISFAVGSSIDSRVILDQSGAEKLIGLGDMLFSRPQWPKPHRIQGAYVSEDEINAVVAHLKEQAEPDYHEEILQLKNVGSGSNNDMGDDDPLLWDAADIVVTSGIGSTSLLQRRLKVGYARAGRIMDMLEAKDIVGPPDGSKPREVLADVEDLESIKTFDRIEQDEQ